MTKKRFLPFLLLLFVLLPAVHPSPRFTLYGFASLKGDSSAPGDLFRYPAGFGIGSEVVGLGLRGLVLALDVTWNGMEPVDSAASYGFSWLILGGLSAGWRFFIPMSRDSAIHITPKIGGGFYLRSVDYLGVRQNLGRPYLEMAVEGGLITENNLIMDVAFTLDVLFDNEPIWLPGVRIRTGYVFKGERR